MKTHIGEIEKPKRGETETNIDLLNNIEQISETDNSSRSPVSHVSRQLEQPNEARSEPRDFGLNTRANCFVCDPDWCPDYKKKICNGKKPA